MELMLCRGAFVFVRYGGHIYGFLPQQQIRILTHCGSSISTTVYPNGPFSCLLSALVGRKVSPFCSGIVGLLASGETDDVILHVDVRLHYQCCLSINFQTGNYTKGSSCH